mgnify:CR=1 FL=1
MLTPSLDSKLEGVSSGAIIKFNDDIPALGKSNIEVSVLVKEIKENSCLTVPAIPELIFTQNHASNFTKAAEILGVNIHQLPREAGHS